MRSHTHKNSKNTRKKEKFYVGDPLLRGSGGVISPHIYKKKKKKEKTPIKIRRMSGRKDEAMMN